MCELIEEEVRQECAKIRAAYPWLEETTIERYAEQALKNKHKNGSLQKTECDA